MPNPFKFLFYIFFSDIVSKYLDNSQSMGILVKFTKCAAICSSIFINVLFVMFAVLSCTALPQWSGVEVSSSNRTYLSEVNATCVTGTYFKGTDNVTAIYTRCGEEGRWTPDVPECTGKCLEQVQVIRQ